MPMRIILVRHADAVSRPESGVNYDAERPLSEQGRREAKEVGQYLNFLRCVPDPIVTSPFVRAQETAWLIAGELPVKPTVQPATILAPGSGCDELLRTAMNYGEPQRRWLLAVMHEPDVSHVLGTLLCEGKVWPLPVGPADVFGLEVRSQRGSSEAELAFQYSPNRLAALKGR